MAAAWISKDILTGLGVVLFFTGTAGVSGIVLTVLAIVTVFLAIYAALLKAIEILDEGGNCAAATAEMYFGVATMLTAIATLFKISSTPVDKLVFKLIGSMYGSELFKSVAGSRACH